MGDGGELRFGQYGDTIARLGARDLAAAPRPDNKTITLSLLWV